MKILNKIILCALALASPLAGCDTEELHDLNINPNALNEVSMNYLFTAAQLGAASGGSEGDNRYIDWRTNIGYCSYWMQHLANAGAGGLAAGDKYLENVESDNAPWEFMYGGQLKNLNEVIRQTGDGGFEAGMRKNTREASRILRAFLFQRLTDYYGNIPYTQAVKGLESAIFLPEYDTQEFIYKDLLKELDEAQAAISASNADEGFAAADMYFKGDVTKWKRWANSLMLRMAMRMSVADAATAATYVTKAVANGVMTSNADNVWVPMSETPSLWVNQNGISRAFINGDGGQSRLMSKTLIDALMGTDKASAADDDPRLMIYTDGINNSTITDPLKQMGLPNGLDGGTLDAYYATLTPPVASGTNSALVFSGLNLKFLDRSEPYMLMNYAEVEFLQAEAKERNIGTVAGTAKSHYEAGVKAAMQMLTPYDASFTVSDAAVTTYLATYPYTDGSPDALKMIGTQMWLSKFLNWWEAWADYRRTGFPALVEINYPGNISNGKIPTKLRYPTHEVATNSANMEAGGDENVPTAKVWWDKN
jgi:hypothetical protein